MSIFKKDNKISSTVFILGVIAALELVAILFLIIIYPNITGFHGKTVKPVDNFQYQDTVTCTIIYTTYNEPGVLGISLPWLEYKKFTMMGLNTDNPQLLVDGEKRVGYVKDYEGDTHLTLSMDPQSWNTDVISLVKSTGSFVRTITGLQAGDTKFYYAIAQKGRCE